MVEMTTVKVLALIAATTAQVGLASGETWETTVIGERPRIPAKETRSSCAAIAATATANENSSGRFRRIAKEILGDVYDETVEWQPVLSMDEEEMDACEFSAADGSVHKFAVLEQLGNCAPYYWTASGVGTNKTLELDCYIKEKCLPKDGSKIALFENAMSADDVDIMECGRKITAPYDKFYFALIDEKPGANWAHPCRYVFVSEDMTRFTVLFKWWSPSVFRKGTREEIHLKQAGAGGASAVESLESVKNKVYEYARNIESNAISYSAGDKSKSYFVLISGGQMPRQNGIRFWSDTAMLYSTLTKKYGIDKNHIWVYMSDGNSSGADANLASTNDGVTPVLVDSPKDLDGDGSGDITGAATADNLSLCFTSLKTSLSLDDQLFIFITSHGGPDGTPGVLNYDCVACLFDEYGATEFRDDELSGWTKGIACPVAVAVETCYSGGFVDDIVATPNRAIGTACNHYESSTGFHNGGAWTGDVAGKVVSYNAWSEPLIAAFRGCHAKPYSQGGYPWVDTDISVAADANGDELVSFFEAASYAAANDVYAVSGKEHPQYGESSSGVGDGIFILKQIGSAVATKPTIPAAPAASLSGTTLSWTAASGARCYRVYRSSSGPFAEPAPYSGWITATQYAIEKPAEHGCYHYWVKASGTADESGASGFGAAIAVPYDSSYKIYTSEADDTASHTVEGTGVIGVMQGARLRCTPKNSLSGLSAKINYNGTYIDLAQNEYSKVGDNAIVMGGGQILYQWQSKNSNTAPRYGGFSSTVIGGSVSGWWNRDHFFYQAGKTALTIGGNTSLSAAAEKRAYTVAVTCTPASAAWTATADKSWITLYKTSSNGSGVLGFIVDENNEGERRGTISFKQNGTTCATLSVVQEAAAVQTYTVTGLSATKNRYDGVVVTWDEIPVEGISYFVYRSTDSAGAARKRLGWTHAATYPDTTAEAGVQYYYWVYAGISLDDAGELSGPAPGIRLVKSGPTPPAWTPVAKEDTMIVYATVFDISANAAIDADGTRLGAFAANGECRGWAAVMDGPAGRLFQLSVGVESATESGIALKVWNPATGEVVEIPERISCNSDKQIGTIAAPRGFKIGALEQAIPLKTGWNWISTYLVAEDQSVDAVFDSCTFADEDVVKTSSGSATYYGGKWFPSSFKIEPGVAYVVKKSAGGSETLPIRGTLSAAGIPVEAGWNWIGSTVSEPVEISACTHSAGFANDDIVTTSGGDTATYYGGAWWPPSFEIKPGTGYKAKLAKAGTFSVAAANANGAVAALKKTALLAVADANAGGKPAWTPVAQEDTLIAYLQIKDAKGNRFESAGSVLAAFTSGGECRGVAEVMDGPSGKIFQLSIGVANSEGAGYAFSLKLWDAASGETHDIDGKVVCNADKIVGKIYSPQVMTVKTETPDPPSPETYTVTFLANGGTGTMAAQTLTEGVEQALAKNRFTKANFIFDGWKDQYGGTYADGERIVATGDLTLTAQWKSAPPSGTSGGVSVYADSEQAGAKGTATISPSGGEIAAGTKLTLKAKPANKNTVFAYWTDADGNIVRGGDNALAGLAATMTAYASGGDMEYRAVFRLKSACEKPVVESGDPFGESNGGFASENSMVGVAYKAQVAVNAEAYPVKFTAKGLPPGLKINAATGVISGVPTKAGTFKPTITIKSAANSKLKPAVSKSVMKIAKLPAWAYGTFNGCSMDSRAASVKITVGSTGKISGKIVTGGITWTLTATSYATAYESFWGESGQGMEFAVSGTASATVSGKKTTVPWQWKLHAPSYYEYERIMDSSGEGELLAGSTLAFSATRSVWKDASAKNLLTAKWIAGVYDSGYLGYSSAYGEYGSGSDNLTFTVSASGSVKIAGTLYDGRKVSLSTTVVHCDGSDEIHFYIPPQTALVKDYWGATQKIIYPEWSKVIYLPNDNAVRRRQGVYAAIDETSKGSGTIKYSTPYGQAEAGKTVTVTATPDKGSVFAYWSWGGPGYVASYSPSYKIVMEDCDVSGLTAVFLRISDFKTAPEEPYVSDGAGLFDEMAVGVPFEATIEIGEWYRPVKFSAKNLPAGLKLNATTGVISGVPSAAGSKTITITATSVANAKLKSPALSIPATVKPLEAWAKGTFKGTGTIDGKNASATLTVGTNGKVSGKFIVAKKSYSFSAAAFSEACTDSNWVVTGFVANAKAKYAGKTRAVAVLIERLEDGSSAVAYVQIGDPSAPLGVFELSR